MQKPTNNLMEAALCDFYAVKLSSIYSSKFYCFKTDTEIFLKTLNLMNSRKTKFLLVGLGMALLLNTIARAYQTIQ